MYLNCDDWNHSFIDWCIVRFPSKWDVVYMYARTFIWTFVKAYVNTFGAWLTNSILVAWHGFPSRSIILTIKLWKTTRHLLIHRSLINDYSSSVFLFFTSQSLVMRKTLASQQVTKLDTKTQNSTYLCLIPKQISHWLFSQGRFLDIRS